MLISRKMYYKYYSAARAVVTLLLFFLLIENVFLSCRTLPLLITYYSQTILFNLIINEKLLMPSRNI